MKKLYSTIMMLAIMVAALSFTACGGDDDDDNGGSGGGGSNSASSLTVVKSNGEKYVSLDGLEWASSYNSNGSLTDGAIYCQMTKENAVNMSYLYINLVNGEKSISDFQNGYDLGKPTINFGAYPSSDNKYKYVSGTIKVIGNNGKEFTLKFDKYKAEKTSGSNIVINGTMYVEKEKFYY